MNTRTALVTPSAVLAVSVEDARRQVREKSLAHDDRLTGLSRSAASTLEEITGNLFIQQTWNVYYRCWQEAFKLPIGPTISVDSVNYTVEAGTESPVATTVYGSFVGARPPHGADIFLKPSQDWPTATLYPGWPIRIELTVGWAPEQTVDTAEADTTSTELKMTAHGLVDGDIILNSTRTAQRTVHYVDADTVRVDALVSQATGDSIRKFKASLIPQTFQQAMRQLIGKYFEQTDDALITPAGSSLQDLPTGTADALAKRFAMRQVI